ncbi:hypothetical protein [Nitratireductor aquibiodomus]|uniref:hypothetical protein n=1 Tax=Nitratireductor aquibiodomus TaxID=204799 RepID=UPI000318553B|nr:hypothetical protein [Nitratireductor aquibiodomus]
MYFIANWGVIMFFRQGWLAASTCLGTAFYIGLATLHANAQVFEINTPTTIPFNPATVGTPSGTINITDTGSIITQYAGNHAIQPYVAGGVTGRWDVNVDGTVRSTASSTIGLYAIWLRNGGDVTVGSSGNVEGSNIGIMVDAGFSSVVNHGAIEGALASISLQGGGTVTNYGALIGGIAGGSFGLPSTFVNKASGTVTASGPVSGSSPFGFLLNAGGAFENAGIVNFNNVSQGLWAHASTTFTNTGTYNVLGVATYAPRIDGALFQTGDIVASNTGAIVSRDIGLFGYQNTSFSLFNSGSITAQNLDAVYVRYGSGATSVSQTAGNISAGRNAIIIKESAASTVEIFGGAIEAGTTDPTGVGVLFEDNSGLSMLTVADATISAPATAIQSKGTELSVDLRDGAVINGDILLDTADDKLALSTGATVNGEIDGGGGDDALELDGAGSGALAISIENFETLDVLGGQWALDGNYSFTGGTLLSGGVLVVNGQLDTVMAINSGARLQGSGRVGSAVFASGATVAPGNSIGTLSMNSATFNAGSVYEVELKNGGFTAGSHNDLLDSTNVTINGGTVHVTPENGSDDGSTYTPGTYIIVTSANPLAGAGFDSVTDDYAFLDFTDSYDANNVYLTSMLSVTPVYGLLRVRHVRQSMRDG